MSQKLNSSLAALVLLLKLLALLLLSRGLELAQQLLALSIGSLSFRAGVASSEVGDLVGNTLLHLVQVGSQTLAHVALCGGAWSLVFNSLGRAAGDFGGESNHLSYGVVVEDGCCDEGGSTKGQSHQVDSGG